MVAKIVFRLCFALLFVPVLALCIWLPIIYMAIGSAIPSVIAFWLILLCAELAALILYFRWPWIAVIVSWVSLLMILYRSRDLTPTLAAQGWGTRLLTR
jgi:hypothetical protein